MKYIRYLLKNIILFLIITILIFAIVRMIPISPVEMLLSQYNLPLTEENKLILLKEFGLQENIFIQYFNWLKELLSLNFGYTYSSHIYIMDELKRKLPYSIIIGMVSMLLSIIFSFFMGYFASLKENGTFDNFTRLLSIFTLSFPSFILSIIIIYYFGVKLHIISFFSGSNFWGIFFAIIIMTVYQSSNLIRITRTAFLKQKDETYVKCYLIRGYKLKNIFLRHCYKPVLYSILSASLSKFSTVIGGSIVLEYAFGIPGISYFLITSITGRDYNVIQAYLIILFLWMFVVHAVVDFLLGLLKERK